MRRVQYPHYSWDVRQSANGMMSQAVNLKAASNKGLRPIMAIGEFHSGRPRMDAKLQIDAVTLAPLSLLACAAETAFSAFPLVGLPVSSTSKRSGRAWGQRRNFAGSSGRPSYPSRSKLLPFDGGAYARHRTATCSNRGLEPLQDIQVYGDLMDYDDLAGEHAARDFLNA